MKAICDLGSAISRIAMYNTKVFRLKNAHQLALRT